MKHRVCECAETRRNLERENKPGGVKIGFCKFITVSLFCMLTSPLWADEGYLSCMDQTCCSGYSGVYWNTSGAGACSSCNFATVTSFGYCTGGVRTNCNSDYPKAAEFASSSDHCYREIACAGENDAVPDENNNNARLYANGCIEYGDDNRCFNAISSNYPYWTSDYHMEGTSDNAKCYSNTRACTLFNYRKAREETDASHSASGNNDVIITGNAQWYNSYWEVYGCYKKENRENISNENCTGVTIAQASNDNNTVTNVTNVLVYYDSPQQRQDNTNCPSCWRYRCTSCPEGYQYNSGTQGQYSSCSGDNVICGCAETTPGYYSTGGSFCNYTFDQDIFNGNNFADNFCPSPSEDYVHPCLEPGMTSNRGATSREQCHYGSGNGTQFCDAFGCVWLDDLSFDSTNQTYSWNGDVHLVGVFYEENRDYMCPDAPPTPRYFWGYDKDGNPINAQGNIVDNCRRN